MARSRWHREKGLVGSCGSAEWFTLFPCPFFFVCLIWIMQGSRRWSGGVWRVGDYVRWWLVGLHEEAPVLWRWLVDATACFVGLALQLQVEMILMGGAMEVGYRKALGGFFFL